MEKTSEQVLAEAYACLRGSREDEAYTLIVAILGFIALAACVIGIAQFFSVNAIRFGTVWSWQRIPWQMIAAWTIWFGSALISYRSSSARWQNFSLAIMVAGTAGMIVFALRAAL